MSSIERDKEAELVKRLRRSEPAAVEELCNAYFDRLYSLVFNQVGRDHQTAEDIVQETFLAALNSVGKFRGQSKLYTWLCGIAHHKVLDFYRQQERESRRGKWTLSTGAIEPEQIPDNEPSLDTIIESSETHHMVEQALFNFPPDYRQVLIYKYVEEMSVSEISQVMGRSSKSVEGLLTRARKALRASLTSPGEG